MRQPLRLMHPRHGAKGMLQDLRRRVSWQAVTQFDPVTRDTLQCRKSDNLSWLPQHFALGVGA